MSEGSWRIVLAVPWVAIACAGDDGAALGATTGSLTVATMVATPGDATGSTNASTGSEPSSGGAGSGSAGGSSTSSGIECPEAVGSEDIQSIFETNCVAYCHSQGGAWPVLDLSDPAYDRIVDIAGGEQIPLSGNAALRLIAPNDVENSYILHKLRGTHARAIGDAEAAGLRMPATAAGEEKGAPLPNEEIGLIDCWVEAGAPL